MHSESVPSLNDKCAKPMYQAKEPDYILSTWNYQFALLERPNNPVGILFWAFCPWSCLLWHWHWSKVSGRTKRGWDNADAYRNGTWFSWPRKWLGSCPVRTWYGPTGKKSGCLVYAFGAQSRPSNVQLVDSSACWSIVRTNHDIAWGWTLVHQGNLGQINFVMISSAAVFVGL